MPEVIDCPNCRRKLQLPDDRIGQPVQCPACRTTFQGRLAASAPIPPRNRESGPSFPPERSPSDRASHDRASHDRPRDRGPFDIDGGRPLQRHRGGTILAFGILSLLPCFLSSLLFGLLAWSMGDSDLRDMRSGGMDRTGEGLVVAGKTMGIVGILLWSIVYFFVCLGKFR